LKRSLLAALALSVAAFAAPPVDAWRGISYAGGNPEDALKHKLDIYARKDARKAPVLLFVHGGAWSVGDRARYEKLGNRFAADGVTTVVVSYRLAPTNQHPAQIEDVAAALAWTARHIGKYGGDPERIFVAGHSAGAHLAALLSLDGTYLKVHGLAPGVIRGTIAMSGVFEIRGPRWVFGDDPRMWKQASPLQHVKSGAPRFLIAYCQHDLPTLPAQARRFHRALRDAGADAELLEIRDRSHISEIRRLWEHGDPTAQAMLRFIGR
jgi:acetyl esterase/lipase